MLLKNAMNRDIIDLSNINEKETFMKKTIAFALILLILLSFLTACNITTNKSGVLAGEAKSTAKVKEMVTALADERITDAKALMHPTVAETSDAAIAQMSVYLSGRTGESIELLSIKSSTSNGSSGANIQEETTYRITMTDGDVVYLNVVYLTDGNGTGFTSFQLVLGVI